MKIGTWNVRSLFWSGALKVLHNELSNLDFDIVALQETQKVVSKNLITFSYSIVDYKVKNMNLVAVLMLVENF